MPLPWIVLDRYGDVVAMFAQEGHARSFVQRWGMEFRLAYVGDVPASHEGQPS